MMSGARLRTLRGRRSEREDRVLTEVDRAASAPGQSRSGRCRDAQRAGGRRLVTGARRPSGSLIVVETDVDTVLVACVALDRVRALDRRHHVAGIVFGPRQQAEVVAGDEDRPGHVRPLLDVGQRDVPPGATEAGELSGHRDADLAVVRRDAVLTGVRERGRARALAGLAGKTKTADCGHGKHGERRAYGARTFSTLPFAITFALEGANALRSVEPCVHRARRLYRPCYRPCS